ncbi:MAG: CBS domain-containing protein [Magnetospirillum sp.]|nr:CBS domain-containing protein [Magnetospirillum sp.]
MLGMVTDRDIAVRGAVLNRPLGNVSIGEVMSIGVCSVREDDSVEDAERQMCAHQVRRLPVVDADDRLVGIISLADLARAGQQVLSAEALEAIVEPSEFPRAI